MKYRTILFDFDGTLADSAALSISIMNSLAPEFGFAPIVPDEVPQLKKMSARELLVQRAHIPLWHIPKIRRLERRVREEFTKRASEIQTFEGVPEMMQDLYKSGYEIGIVSSNAHEVVAGLLARTGIQVHFIHAGSAFFGKARAIRGALSEYGVDRRYAVYIGDELRDIEACKKVGMGMIAVGWGLNASEILKAAGVEVAATPQALLSILGAQQ
jgi:phosphoglycolate phosphatase